MKELRLRRNKFIVKGEKYTVIFCHVQKKCEINKICKKFSAIKMGDIKEIRSCARFISKVIIESIPDYAKNEWVIAGIPNVMPSAAQYIGKEISKLLKKKYVQLKMKSWKNSLYYLDLKPGDRIKELRKLVYCDVNLSGKKIIIIDDAVSSGSVLRASGEILIDNGAEDIRAFAFVKFMEEKNAEKEASLLNYRLKGVRYLVKIAGDSRNPVLSRMVSVSKNLSSPEFCYLLKNMTSGRRKKLIHYLK
ncbi:MAG: hypothetical protein WC831_04900 [Parcubacteria group bacterium]|jgi:pyrimidine operon attenuation protein/uracil phosphoribosyltransferase